MIRKALQPIREKILYAIRQGITPHKLALTCAFGVTFAIFPIYGTTTLLCFAVAIAFRLNIVIIQAINYLLTPLQLALILPFFQAGIIMFQLPEFAIGGQELSMRIKAEGYSVLQDLGMMVVGGIATWVLVSVPLFFALFFIIKMWFIKRMNKAD